MKTIVLLLGALLALQAPPRSGGPRDGQAAGVPWPVLAAERQWAGADVLLPMLSSPDVGVQVAALQALGRLEDPTLVPAMLALQTTPAIPRGAIGNAIAQALFKFDPRKDPELIHRVLAWMSTVALDTHRPVAYQIVEPIGRIAYTTPDEVHAAEALLVRIAKETSQNPELAAVYRAAIASLESLGRLNARTAKFDAETVTLLVRSAGRTFANDPSVALSALVSGGALDAATERIGLKDASSSVRRVAVAVLAGSGGGLDDEERAASIRTALRDDSAQVRYEALRGYVRRVAPTAGCQPIVDLLNDADPHVSRAAFDALGDLCKDDDDITTRLQVEARTPRLPEWHREAHAFVALAKRSPDRAAIAMEAFATHPLPWVRVYAVRAAVAAGDRLHLEKLAYDSNANVREATLAPLRRLEHADAEPSIVAALGSSDVQLLRTAATLLKESPRAHRDFAPLLSALQRLTSQGKETSRDARLPLLDAIVAHADPGDWTELRPFLKDFDPKVAAKAAEAITRLSGEAAVADPIPVARGWASRFSRLTDTCVTVEMATGPSFRMVMDWDAAPMTADWFLTRATVDHYYDGLELWRVVPNFVIQGGGPGGNEYSGAPFFMRDEISASSHNVRGSVGLSTRGRNTADGQFFVNLVSNPRLDYDYTIFAHVLDMAAVDALEEGVVIRSIVAGCRR